MRAYYTNLASLLAALVLIQLLGGCGSRAKRWLVYDKGPAADVVAIDVDSFRGPVTIVANPDIPNISVRARLRAFNDIRDQRGNVVYPNGEDHTLELIDVVSELTTDGQRHGVLRVTTSTDFEYPDDQWVGLYINVPIVDGVRVRTRDGNVDLVNVRGAVDVIADNGDVIVRSAKPLLQPVDIIAVNGSIEYRIKPESEGHFDVEAVNGRADFRGFKGWSNVRQRGASEFQAMLGTGINPVVLRATNGNVRIVVTDDPVPVGYMKTHTWMFLK